MHVLDDIIPKVIGSPAFVGCQDGSQVVFKPLRIGVITEVRVADGVVSVEFEASHTIRVRPIVPMREAVAALLAAIGTAKTAAQASEAIYAISDFGADDNAAVQAAASLALSKLSAIVAALRENMWRRANSTDEAAFSTILDRVDAALGINPDGTLSRAHDTITGFMHQMAQRKPIVAMLSMSGEKSAN